MSAQAHAAMVAAVAPYIDTAISKTVNVPADYPYADFQGLYLQAWQSGLKGLATYRPNAWWARCSAPRRTAGRSPAHADGHATAPTAAWRWTGCRRRCWQSLRWPGRPELPGGNPAWTYMVQHPIRRLRLFVGELPAELSGPGRACKNRPFEVWVNGAEQPRGLGALAKTLSMDMRAHDAAWLQPEA
jgi:ribonucleoside-diphosphate reductase alpha chain